MLLTEMLAELQSMCTCKPYFTRVALIPPRAWVPALAVPRPASPDVSTPRARRGLRRGTIDETLVYP